MPGAEESKVVRDFKKSMGENERGAVAVAAIHALTNLIKESGASTIMELEILLKAAQEQLQEMNFEGQRSKAIQLTAACELFARHVTRTALDVGNFDACKKRLIDRGERFAAQADVSRAVIADNMLPFIRDGMSILVHGYSNVVIIALSKAAAAGIRFKVVLTEGQPERDGYKVCEELHKKGIPTELIVDSGVGFVMQEVDMVLTGAAGVCESGGIINKLGTYQLSVIAREAKKPFYVAAESYKFCRLYPLSPTDLPEAEREAPATLQSGVKVRRPPSDFTPPAHITLLLTDIGVLTPSAVSDELIKLYY
mmetsp:Transcript_28285/g.57107  ORF Transcript_28285/g.57107 Transcript_28285/m.57107 type:complete len:310 (+) Transcript_28285:42-971(+)|eukprot:CAMPEP_0196735766 /NCGR_PEP_ID=MMETSP1091-20130531/14073_1 /TAXON_ID=302021 /ORGANISM="Rhodomonas sp., Strain CCMP768" /LENGTH=309 /DNA_ID=CAMNT_0042079433 /DNA_START=54 /DNA_END=983 /DNA_ORIENTATION=+